MMPASGDDVGLEKIGSIATRYRLAMMIGDDAWLRERSADTQLARVTPSCAQSSVDDYKATFMM